MIFNHLQGVEMNAYARRANISAMLIEKAHTTREIADKLGTSTENVCHDIRALIKHGCCKVEGFSATFRTYRCTRQVTADELKPKKSNEQKVGGKKLDIASLPESLRMMFGYTDLEPKGGTFIDNADFHPTPTRTSPVKVHIGNAWGQIMEMAQ